MLNWAQSVQNLAFVVEQFLVDDIRERQVSGAIFPSALKELHTVSRLCNGAQFETSADASSHPSERAIKGDATDTAILRFAESLPGFNCQCLLESYDKVFEIPFNSRNKWMIYSCLEGYS